MKKNNVAVKKVLSLVLGIVMVLGLAVPSAVYANDGIGVNIDGVAVEFPNARPALVDGRTLVPVRAVFEALGFEADWDIPTQTATITRGDDTIIITIGNATFYTNGIAHAFDVPAQIINDSTMLPLRAVVESVGYTLDWDGSTQTVLITRPTPQEDQVDFAQQVFNLINQERQAAGLAPLTWDSTLADTAQLRADHNLTEVTGAHILALDSSLPHNNNNHVNPEFRVNQWMNSSVGAITNRDRVLNPQATSVGIGFAEVHLEGSNVMNPGLHTSITVLFSTATGELAPAADPFNVDNLAAAGNFPRPSMTLPNRRLTDQERQQWIEDYRSFGPLAFDLEVARLVNEIRAEHGLSQLEIDETLMMAALFYAQTMNQFGGLGHNAGPYATDPSATGGASWNVLEAFNGGNPGGGGSNGSSARITPRGLVDTWMNSPPHRQNILNPRHEIIGSGSFRPESGSMFHYLFMVRSN